MRRNLPSRSNLFLMELIITILFFALASALCMQFFVKAKELSLASEAKNHALILAKSTASDFTRAAGDKDTLLGLLDASATDASTQEENRLIGYYDKDWKSTDADGSVYRMEITWRTDPDTKHLMTGSIEVFGTVSLLKLPVSCAVAPQI